MATNKMSLQREVLEELEGLPRESVAEVLDFVVFLKERSRRGRPQGELPFVPASQLDHWTGLVSWGGDAVTDSECLYDESL